MLTQLSPLSPLSSLGSAAVDAATAAATGGASTVASALLPSWSGRAVVIILGLLLIAAGIFSFDSTRKLVVEGTKAAAAAA